MKKVTTKKSTKKVVDNKDNQKFFLFFFASLAILGFFIIKPFIATIIVSSVVAYALYPIYKRLLWKIKRKGLTASIMIFLLLLIVAVPLAMVSVHLTKESYDIYKKIKGAYESDDTPFAICENNNGTICNLYSSTIIESDEGGFTFNQYLLKSSGDLLTSILSHASDILLNISSLILHVFIGLFIIFYLFVDGERIVVIIKNSLPLESDYKSTVLRQVDDMVYATIYGAIVLALVQGILALIGYLIFGAPSPWMLGLLTILFAFVPFLGTAIIWVPVSIFMLVSAINSGDSSLIAKAVGLLMYGLIVVSMSDNILRPKIVGHRAHVHPLLILLGVFGGLAMFGFAGIIVGPLILTIFVSAFKVYEERQKRDGV